MSAVVEFNLCLLLVLGLWKKYFIEHSRAERWVRMFIIIEVGKKRIVREEWMPLLLTAVCMLLASAFRPSYGRGT